MTNNYYSVNSYRLLITALIFWGATYVSISNEIPSPSLLLAKQTSSNLASSSQFATYLGGSNVDDCDGIAVDASGSIYLACHSNSKDFPGLNGKKDSSDIDAYVSKLDPHTGKLVYTTRLGGSAYDAAVSIEVGNDGSVFVAGYTVSSDFHTTNDAIQRTFGGAGDIFLTKLNPDGLIEYSTYLGGSDQDVCRGMVVDNKNRIYLAGITLSENFPGVRRLDLRKTRGKGDAFVASWGLREQGSLKFALLGGSELDEIRGIALGPSGNLYASGVTHSVDFPVKSARQHRLKGNSDAFLVKLRSADFSLAYSILVGGSEEELGSGLAVDRAGNAYLTGSTRSADFPVSVKAFQRQYAGGQDAFVAKLNSAGTRFLYSTYIGGTGEDSAGFNGKIMTIDSEGNTWVVGFTKSRDFPIGAGLQTAYGGGELDSFAIALDPSGSRLKFSSYYGGDAFDNIEGIALAADGSI
jgi:beta-propeller repeat-containing protein